MQATRIEIIWDHDHGTANEGWYIRRYFADGHDEDENTGDSGYDLSDTDADVCAGLLGVEETDIPVIVKR